MDHYLTFSIEACSLTLPENRRFVEVWIYRLRPEEGLKCMCEYAFIYDTMYVCMYILAQEAVRTGTLL